MKNGALSKKEQDMISTNQQELLGDCVQKWDSFYEANYSWIYDIVVSIVRNTLTAKTLTDKFMSQLILAVPEVVVEEDREAILKELALLFPYLGKSVSKAKELSAGRLLNIYYNPN
ncbi:MAG: hypothetical protein AAFR14_09940 [Bacteroidota bacterium]